MRALSIHQPYAELIRLGTKQWETGRSWPMPASVIGERIAICSTLQAPRPGPVGGYWAGRTSRSGPWVMSKREDIVHLADNWPLMLTFGVVRCTAVVAECLPVVDQRIDAAHILTGDGDGHLWVADEVDLECHGPGLYEKVQNAGIIDDQLPYGFWTPGTYATRLVDVKPTDPIPVKGKQRLWHLPADVAEAVA